MDKENCSKRTKGYTLVELIVVLAIMAILGTMLMSMLDVGVNFYRTADMTMDNENNARIAIAYITVKIRQNDVTGGVSVPYESVLEIKDTKDITGQNFFWIYFDGDKLFEHYGTKYTPNSNDTVIADNLTSVDIKQSDVEIEQSDIRRTITVNVTANDTSVALSSSITLRCLLQQS